jgi:hypothetical protein
MNHTNLRTYAPAELDALEARLALRMTARLTEHAADLPQDVSERLRFAREQALERARAARKAEVAESTVVVGSGSTLSLGRGGEGGASWWVQVASVLPLIALLAGLVFIQRLHNDSQISAAAEIDASLLADDLPPSAYSDPGFVEFLKAPLD